MAASGLDHLKNDYRRRFCRPSRVPDINTNQNQNMLEILQNCFEEKSLFDDIITNSTKSVLYSTPKMKNSCTESSGKDCQKSHPRSFPVSSREKEASLQGIVEPNEAASESVQAHEIYQKVLAADVCSKRTPDLTKNSGKKLNVLCAEADEEFYISVGSPAVPLHEKPSKSQNDISSAQKRETYTFGNSVNMLSSRTEISLKTKKRLNFEDKDILKKVERETNKSEVEDKISGQEERKLSETSPKRVQDTEYEIQSQTKKSFSTLFLETVKRKGEPSPIVRHTASAPSHSSPPNVTKLLEDEFIIDESDRSFVSQSWITIPRKSRPLKQHTISSVESTAVLQCKKAREHESVLPVTLTNDKHLHKTHPEEKSEPPNEKKPSTSCTLIDELENSEKAEKPSGNKRTTKQKQKRKLKTIVVEEQLDTGQSNDENMSHIAHDKLPGNSNRTIEGCGEMRNGHNAKKEMPPVEHMKTKCSTKKDKKESRKKHFSSESKRKKIVPEEITSTVTRSHRISRRPSDWWVVNAEESPVHSNSVKNDVSVYHSTRQEPAKKTNQSSKKIVKKTILSKRQKASTQGNSRVQKLLNVKGSRSIFDLDEVSSCPQNEPLENAQIDLIKKKNLDCSRTTGLSKDQDVIMSTENVHLKSPTSEDTCRTPVEAPVDSGESETSVLEESGPSRLKNYLISGKNNSDVNNAVQENLDDLRVKRYKVASRNEMHHKLVLPSNTPNVRRTKRIRSKPLEYWRGERVDYQETPSGGLVIGGILSPETVISKRKAKGNVGKDNKIDNRKRICLDNVEKKSKLVVNLGIPLGDPFQPTQVKDPETREIIFMDLIRPRDTYQFFVEHGKLKVYKTLDTPLFSTGKLILGPYEEKGKQHVGEDILVFYVNVGDLLCTLHETPYAITTGDSFYVPSGNYYNIKNLLNEESILLFTQIKR
ncbi:centromere protein C isoform X2 [Fukomys damarensis]|uniref:centromere protein C isoform X2 n=1 Tax=Fukomys damarensis TaxID=885580 RepID=UPI00053FE1AD|nr:centromere protein C isoform X2 [Fukomys damarensis]